MCNITTRLIFYVDDYEVDLVTPVPRQGRTSYDVKNPICHS